MLKKPGFSNELGFSPFITTGTDHKSSQSVGAGERIREPVHRWNGRCAIAIY
ncbi:MAG: hypothetical protein MUC60_17245 [Oscillatoria sp. Prado101]|nr:hypothetical protein [Oscillatoria sp. Prado101]